jgi:chemotaxis protein methyltransferase CheR
MTPEPMTALDRVGVLLDRLIGLRADPSLRSRLRRCVVDAAQTRGMTVDEYVGCLTADEALVDDLLNRVTVQESGFFRHPEQFAVLAGQVLPAVAGEVRFWCAASANGQEPYSLAMLLAEEGRTGGVLATDVSTAALRRTAEATYSDREIGTLSAARRATHLTRIDRGWKVVEPVRNRVTVRQHNLLGPIPGDVADCQIVFCRNVLIYFKPEHTTAFLERLADRMAPGAYLFVGSAETIWQVTDRFEPIHLGGTFVYRALARASRSARLRGADRATQTAPGALAAQLPRIAARPTDAQPPTAPPTAPPAAPPPAAPRPAAPPPAAPPPAAPRPAAPRPAAPPPAAPPPAERPAAEVGRDAMASGDAAAAVTAFRRWVYSEPDDPAAHLHLALALEAAGDDRAARRAYRSARAALEHADPTELDAVLGNYEVGEMDRLLAEKGRALPS